MKIKSSINGEITLSFTGVGKHGKACPGHELLTWQLCYLTLFAKIKSSQKFPNIQYAINGTISIACCNI